MASETASPAKPSKEKNPRKIVLAYSGGLDTSVIMRWLIDTYRAEVVAFCADVGQGEDLEAVARKARDTGAVQVIVRDVREAFVRDYVFPALRAAAVYEGYYLLGTSLARPLIARAQMEVMKEVGGDAVSHGATGKGNDQVRFELGYYSFDPGVRVIAPWRIWDLRSRSDCIAYAQKHGIPVPVTPKRPYSTDRNLMHVSYEGGILEDPWAEPPADMFQMTVDPTQAPDQPQTVEVEIDRGVPVAIDGERLAPVALLAKANAVAGRHGVGRIDIVENRFVGTKSRGVYETPGGTLLHAAMRAVEQVTYDREMLRLRDRLVPEYAGLVYNGFWFAPERKALQALIDRMAEQVSGTARLKLFKGSCTITGRKAAEGQGLYRPEFATFERDEVYDQRDAEGFIRLQALRLRIRALVGLE
ncbi:MAG TPA: argininosuccinate synthase [Myxococcota bacterium]|jgi:argininosuccinate synthase|nr:argininosuccinate synthase [Myxococcota bacterium]